MRYISAVVGLLFGFIVVGSVPGVAAASEDYEAWIAGCKTYPELCVPRCQRDKTYCAKQINGYLLTKVHQEFRYEGWNPYPNRIPVISVNNSTPMHGTYLRIYVNDIAEKYIREDLQADPTSVETVDFKNGSIIVKLNSINSGMTYSDGPWLTVMFKLDGYCRGKFGAAGTCVGGDWFYYLYRFKVFHYFDGVEAVGKARPFCIDCHDPVQKGDFVWTAFFDLLKAQLNAKPTTTVKSEQPATTNVANDCAGTPISTVVPADVKKNPASIPPMDAQRMFDCLSWRTFVALNQPASQGDPDGARVWETYRSVFETFQPDDPNWTLRNQSWDDPNSFDPVCDQGLTSDKVLRMTGKQRYSDIIDEDHQAFGNQFNILVDQNGNLTRFEVRLNRDEFEWLKKNNLADTGTYDVGGPIKPVNMLNWQAPPMQFPDNIRGSTKTGAIEIKAAWREMCTNSDPTICPKKDDLKRYYTRDATIYERNPSPGEATCRKAMVGLVGFHIIHKTFWAPQWVWSTFEHVDNVPKVGPPLPTSDVRRTKFSFYSPWMQKFAPDVATCEMQRPGVFKQMPVTPLQLTPPQLTTVAACPNLQNIINSHPSPSKPPKYPVLSPSPNQVTRLDKMTSSSLNNDYQMKLAGTQGLEVFTNYELINTQWPLNGRRKLIGEQHPFATTINMRPCPDAKVDPSCYTTAPLGLRLRNTTLETYQVSYHMPNVKAGTQASSLGCMQCHQPTGLDFSFVWTDAVTATVPLKRDDLSQPPPGSYKASCTGAKMVGLELSASCKKYNGSYVSASLPNAHSCGADIVNLNGKLLCNPTVDSFTVTCKSIAVAGDALSAKCLRRNGASVSAILKLAGYHGLISNCDGVLKKGSC